MKQLDKLYIMKFSIVVATDENNGIGFGENNKYTIPWTNLIDMKFFKQLTLLDNFNNKI